MRYNGRTIESFILLLDEIKRTLLHEWTGSKHRDFENALSKAQKATNELTQEYVAAQHPIPPEDDMAIQRIQTAIGIYRELYEYEQENKRILIALKDHTSLFKEAMAYIGTTQQGRPTRITELAKALHVSHDETRAVMCIAEKYALITVIEDGTREQYLLSKIGVRFVAHMEKLGRNGNLTY